MTQDLKIRAGGLFSLVCAAAAGWLFMLRPLQQARAGAPELDTSIKGAFVLVPLLVVFGAAFLIGGENARYRDVSTHPPKLTALGWTLIVLSLAVAGACFWWMQTQLSALGYQF